jgi:hypothetical protein
MDFRRGKVLKRVNLINKSRGCRGHVVHEGGFVEGASDIEEQGGFRLSGGRSIRDWTGDGDYRDGCTGDWDGRRGTGYWLDWDGGKRGTGYWLDWDGGRRGTGGGNWDGALLIAANAHVWHSSRRGTGDWWDGDGGRRGTGDCGNWDDGRRGTGDWWDWGGGDWGW